MMTFKYYNLFWNFISYKPVDNKLKSSPCAEKIEFNYLSTAAIKISYWKLSKQIKTRKTRQNSKLSVTGNLVKWKKTVILTYYNNGGENEKYKPIIITISNR